MKKTLLIIISALVLSVSLSVFAEALINYPPKDTNIRADVYISKKQPVIDGKIGEKEYFKINIPKSSLSYVLGSDADWKRAKDTEFEAYGAIYDKTFYFALSAHIDEEYYITECEPKYMWAQTALLLSFAKTGSTGRNALEIGIRPDGEYYVWRTYEGIECPLENSFSAVYEDGLLTYEAAVPLSYFKAEEDRDFLFCFSLSVGDYFNGERQTYIQFGKGISGFSESSDADAGKNAALFPTVRILREGEKPSETDDNDNPVSPDTGLDIKSYIILSTAVMAASLTVLYLLRRKRRVN